MRVGAGRRRRRPRGTRTAVRVQRRRSRSPPSRRSSASLWRRPSAARRRSGPRARAESSPTPRAAPARRPRRSRRHGSRAGVRPTPSSTRRTHTSPRKRRPVRRGGHAAAPPWPRTGPRPPMRRGRRGRGAVPRASAVSRRYRRRRSGRPAPRPPRLCGGSCPAQSRSRSTKIPSNDGSDSASSSAAWGGQIESTTSQRVTSAWREPASSSPAAEARTRVASLRPCETQSTECPASRSTAPNAAPISPGCRIPTTLTARR